MSGVEKAVRKELRELNQAELHRLILALNSMQKTNDWGCIAGLHGGGLPKIPEVKINRSSIYCHHGVETFPTWHRAYLATFEYLLQKHDPLKAGFQKANRLMLPFWDWESSRFVNGYPEFLTYPNIRVTIDGKATTIVNPLNSGPSRSGARTTRRVTTSNDVAREIQLRQAPQEATSAMMDASFFEFSNRAAGPTSIETPHDDVHVAVGGDMGRINDAAWDPIFWFHHCNVERLFYSWQRQNPNKASKSPKAVLDPFFPRNQGFSKMPWENDTKIYSPQSDWYNISSLDYTFSYYATAPPRTTQMRERRRFVVFWSVKKPDHSVSVYVYIHRKDQPKYEKPQFSEFGVSGIVRDEGFDDPACAGIISIFAINKAKKDTVCDSCETKEPIAYFLDTTNFLENLNVKNKEEVEVTYRVVNENGEEVQIELPVPEIFWENEFLSDSLDTNSITHLDRDASKLVGFLKFYGYKEADGPEGLKEALLKYQEYWGLKPDGVLGPVTQGQLTAARSANPDIGDDTQPILLNKLKSGKRKFHFTVTAVDEDLLDSSEPDLGYAKGVQHIAGCFQAWAKPLSEKIGEAVTFDFVSEDQLSLIDVEVTWKNFDGPGGTLACATSKEGLVGCAVQLDRSERWTYTNQKYSVVPVVTHEIGHLFGLSHVNNPESIMNPFYRPEVLNPSELDINNVLALLKA